MKLKASYSFFILPRLFFFSLGRYCIPSSPRNECWMTPISCMNELVLISSCIAPSRAFSRGLSNYSFSNWIATCFRPWDQAHSYNSPWRPLEGSAPWTEHLCWLWTFDCVSRLIFCAFYTEININLYFPFQEGICCPLINSALIKSTPNLLNYQNKISV